MSFSHFPHLQAARNPQIIGLTRREFLRIALGVTAAVGISRLQAEPLERAHVLIIGAGVAGLAANHALRSKGVETLLIEGRSRIGGRVWSQDGLDLGAAWIHGQKGNVLMRWVRETGAHTFPFDYNNIVRFANSARIGNRESARIDSQFAMLEKAIARAQRQRTQPATLESAIASHVAKLPAEQRQGLRYAINTNITHEYAEDPAGLSLRYFDDGADLRGGDLLLPEGYSQILRAVHPGNELRTGHRVRQIRWGDSGVIVRTDKGSFAGESAIVTLPLGVLKADAKAGGVEFHPDLPPAQKIAIQRLGFGTLNKLFLQFPRATWPSDSQLFGFVGVDGWWEEWVNFVPITGEACLCGFNAGRIGRLAGEMSDSTLVKSAMRVLRKMFGAALPEPVNAIATRWNHDPFSLGSYSCYAPGSSPQDRENLSAPVGGRLFFAGEACSIAHPATVHGALQSGLSAAQLALG